eukprot:846676-Amphidinium_carterae.1
MKLVQGKQMPPGLLESSPLAPLARLLRIRGPPGTGRTKKDKNWKDDHQAPDQGCMPVPPFHWIWRNSHVAINVVVFVAVVVDASNPFSQVSLTSLTYFIVLSHIFARCLNGSGVNDVSVWGMT